MSLAFFQIHFQKFLESAVGVEFVRAWEIFNALVFICWQMFRVFLPFLIIATVLVGGGLVVLVLVMWICSPSIPEESVEEKKRKDTDSNFSKEVIISQVASGLKNTEKQLIETLTTKARETLGWSAKSYNDGLFIEMIGEVIRKSMFTCTNSICSVIQDCYNPHTPMTNLMANTRGPLAWKWCIPIGIVWVMYLTGNEPYHRHPGLFENLALTGIASLIIRGVSWIIVK